MITPKHRKAELTQKHVVVKTEEKRKADKADAAYATSKLTRVLVRKSLFVTPKKKGGR